MKRRQYQILTILLVISLIILCFVSMFMIFKGTSDSGEEIEEGLTWETLDRADNQTAYASQEPEKPETISEDSVEQMEEVVKTDAESPEVSEEEEPQTLKLELESDNADVESVLSKMTLEEKIYQLFIVTPEALTGAEKVTAAGETTKEKLAKYPVGGIIYFGANVVNPEQTTQMLKNTQQYALENSGIPLFLCIDEEGGRVARIGKNSSFPVTNVGAMANIDSSEEAYEAGETIGSYLKEYGFNVDFAPDADVITNSANKVIGDRSFGTDAKIVAEYAKAYSDGLHSQGILSTYKHFPGHGATEADTHEGYAYTNQSYEELKGDELLPFENAQKDKVDFVMVAHISLPTVVGDDTPSSLSKTVITDMLRKDLGYQGLVVTDALNMGAITQKYGAATACVMSLKAGSDLLLMPADLQSAANKIKQEVEAGNISEDRIDESVRRILKVKLGKIGVE